MEQEPLPGETPLPEAVLFPAESRLLGPQVLELARPPRHGGADLARLELRALAGKHVRQLSSEWGKQSSFFLAAGLLTGLPDGALDQLEGEDVGGLLELVQRMLWPVFDLPSSWVNMDDERRLEEYPRLAQPYELVLDAPARAGRDEVGRLVFRPMTGRVARSCPTKLELRRLPWLVEQLTGSPAAVVDELAGRDLNRALVVAQCFFAASPPRRGRASPGS